MSEYSLGPISQLKRPFPDCCQGHLTFEQWQTILGRLEALDRGAGSTASCCSCFVCCFTCLCCVFCCQETIKKSILRRKLDPEMDGINRDFFKGSHVFSANEEGEITIRVSALNVLKNEILGQQVPIHQQQNQATYTPSYGAPLPGGYGAPQAAYGQHYPPQGQQYPPQQQGQYPPQGQQYPPQQPGPPTHVAPQYGAVEIQQVIPHSGNGTGL